ncbi:hypothetical protein GGE12_000340 [Rhizobium mongolense]|uniref:Uncharacterized protein n=1 Tax=Rhizobium mongolense TaxID=57676 RepID=A0A7W6RIJ9_9HYPH|nr:hypothetical protein [Rhizobium mongolense]
MALWFLVQGAVWWSIFVAAWGLLLVSSIDNLIRPYVLGKTNNLPVLLGLSPWWRHRLWLRWNISWAPLLAVAYSLFREWTMAEVEERSHPTPPSDSRLREFQ